MYITKDSGKRVEFQSGMQREDATGKTRYDLLIPLNCKHSMLIRWAELLTRGAEKYPDRNYEKANSQEEMDRAYQSLWRHFIQYVQGETDEDHASAIFFNIQVIELIKERMEEK